MFMQISWQDYWSLKYKDFEISVIILGCIVVLFAIGWLIDKLRKR